MHKFAFLLLFMVGLLSCSKDEANTNTGTTTKLSDINSLTAYDTAIKSGVSLVFFHATWCPICTEQRPNVEGLTTDASIKNAKLWQVDVDKNKDIISKYTISGQPVILIYKDNVEKHRLLGKGHTSTKLAEMIKALL
jgi:thioredoxin-like negative regulator of GroEL